MGQCHEIFFITHIGTRRRETVARPLERNKEETTKKYSGTGPLGTVILLNFISRFQNKGRAGKVCAESLNRTDPAEAEEIVQTIAESTCQVIERLTIAASTLRV
jgi:hypothetical protein